MPLAVAAYTQLRHLILSGQLAPETAITENAIVDMLAIGKTPVREAMRRLVLEGLLDVTPRLGYTVVGISQQDVDDMFQLRVIAEVAAAELAMERITPDALDRLAALSQVGFAPDDPESLRRYEAADTEFHDIIGACSGNRRLADLITRLITDSRRFVQIVHLTREHGQDAIRQHHAIVEALQAADGEAVATAVRHHVTASWQVVLDNLHVAAGIARG